MRIPHATNRLLVLLALLSAISLAVTVPAMADIGETIIQRCTHGQTLSGFSQAAYGRALKELSADAEEYTDCSQLIRQAQAAAARGGGGGGGAQTGAGAAIPAALTTTPSERSSVARASMLPSAPLNVDGQLIHPGVIHSSIASALSSLPTPLLAILAVLLAGLLAALGGTLRNRVRARRAD